MKALVNAALDLLYPANCLICEKAVLPEGCEGVICPNCRLDVKFVKPPCCDRCALPFPGAIDGHFTCGYCKDLSFHFTRAYASCRAEGTVRTSIHKFKYEKQEYFARHLTEWFVERARQWEVDWSAVDAVAPVPLYPRKERERGFNQAEVLARAIGRAFDRPVITKQLRRVKDTGTQTKLDAEARGQNLRNAFAVRRAEAVAGKRWVLVDDVFTTGATLDGCAKVLRRAGATDVWVMVLARGV